MNDHESSNRIDKHRVIYVKSGNFAATFPFCCCICVYQSSSNVTVHYCICWIIVKFFFFILNLFFLILNPSDKKKYLQKDTRIILICGFIHLILRIHIIIPLINHSLHAEICVTGFSCNLRNVN